MLIIVGDEDHLHQHSYLPGEFSMIALSVRGTIMLPFPQISSNAVGWITTRHFQVFDREFPILGGLRV